METPGPGAGAGPFPGSPHRVLSSSRPTLVLLGKPDCGLCREMRAVVERVLPDVGAGLEEKDVRDDPVLEARYIFEIPVLMLGDREITRHRVTESELRRLLREAGLGRSKGD